MIRVENFSCWLSWQLKRPASDVTSKAPRSIGRNEISCDTLWERPRRFSWFKFYLFFIINRTMSANLNVKPLTGSATGNPRNKTALKPGFSLVGWIRWKNRIYSRSYWIIYELYDSWCYNFQGSEVLVRIWRDWKERSFKCHIMSCQSITNQTTAGWRSVEKFTT